MNQTFKITSVRVFPQLGENENVIAKVEWTVIFERNGFTSVGAGTTLFDVEGIQGFTPFDQVTKEQLVSWVIEREGGQVFIDALSVFHSSMIAIQEIDAQTQSVSLSYVEPQSQSPAPTIVYDLERTD